MVSGIGNSKKQREINDAKGKTQKGNYEIRTYKYNVSVTAIVHACTFQINIVLIQRTIHVGKHAFCCRFAGGQIVIAVRENLRFHNRHQTG